ncbi:MAG: class I SAM-dependent methyltransferase [Gammaproteobacteria bacterium]
MDQLVEQHTSNSNQKQQSQAIVTDQAEKILDLAIELLHIIFSDYQGRAAIRLWYHNAVIGDDKADCTLVFNKDYPLRELILHRDLGRLTEAYLCGDVEVEGDMEKLFDLVDYLQDGKLSLYQRARIFLLAVRLPKRKGRRVNQALNTGTQRDENIKESIAHHYDISNDFYRLWLDPEMNYSCAYFSHPEQTLADAQRDKLDYICRKLRLSPGQKLLDIGCGWGGLALWASRKYGVRVHGITLSKEQYHYDVEKAKALRLDDRVRFELRDYRELPEQEHYDRIVSVGMFEHIGVRNFLTYFSIIKRLLAPGGLFLNHGITNDTGWQPTTITRFINDYIFPDGELARISDVIDMMEKAGLEILDVEALRPHYVMTLRHWIKSLNENRKQVVKASSEYIFKLWRLYMAGSAYYFDQGSTGIYQILACNMRQPWMLPLRRDDLYLNT